METFPDYANLIRGSFRNQIESGLLKFAEASVTAQNINALIESSGISGEIDFLSVDIDGNDYHVYEAINVIHPRVLCLEHNPSYPPPVEWIMDYNPDHKWIPGSDQYGASLKSLELLAAKKGMRLVGCGLYSPNSFFVREDLINDSFHELKGADYHFHPLDYEALSSFPRGIFSSHPRARKLKAFEMYRNLREKVNYERILRKLKRVFGKNEAHRD